MGKVGGGMEKGVVGKEVSSQYFLNVGKDLKKFFEESAVAGNEAIIPGAVQVSPGGIETMNPIDKLKKFPITLNRWLDIELPRIPDLKGDPLDFVLNHDLVIHKENSMWLEFGVFQGRTINQVAKYAQYMKPEGEKIYGFDSFEGLPEDWSIGVVGSSNADDRIMSGKTFDLQGRLPPVEENVELIKGWFDDTLPKFLEKYESNLVENGSDRSDMKIGLLHVDCDIYSSTKTIFTLLQPYILPGTVIVFDELVNYPTFKSHEIKAFFELLQENKHLNFEWIGTACGVDTVMGFRLVQMEGDGTC